jgi:hypothetical protein
MAGGTRRVRGMHTTTCLCGLARLSREVTGRAEKAMYFLAVWLQQPLTGVWQSALVILESESREHSCARASDTPWGMERPRNSSSAVWLATRTRKMAVSNMARDVASPAGISCSTSWCKTCRRQAAWAVQ